MFIKRIGYELKVTFGVTACLPIPSLAVFGILEKLLLGDSPALQLQRYALRDFCLLLSVSAALSVAHLMSVEKDEGFAELRGTYGETLSRQTLLRTLVAFAFAAVIAGLGWVTYSCLSQASLPINLIAPALAPTLFLLGLALLTNNLTGSYWAAAGVVLGLWLLGISPQSRGLWLGGFSLFPSVWQGGMNAQTNTLLLWGAGVLFLLVNLFIGRKHFNHRMAGV